MPLSCTSHECRVETGYLTSETYKQEQIKDCGGCCSACGSDGKRKEAKSEMSLDCEFIALDNIFKSQHIQESSTEAIKNK